jgi:hypothetical protein
MDIGITSNRLDIRMEHCVDGNIQTAHRDRNRFGIFVWTYLNIGM